MADKEIGNFTLESYINEKMEIAISMMINIAKKYLNDDEKVTVDNLLNLDCDEYPVYLYDIEDLSNHSFELGIYYASKNILKKL